MDKQVKDLLLAYMDWEKKQPKNVHQIDAGEYKIVIDGVEVDIPEEEDLIASFEEEAAKLEVTVIITWRSSCEKDWWSCV